MKVRVASGVIVVLLLSYLTGLAISVRPSVVPAREGVSTSVEAPSGMDDTIYPPMDTPMVDPAITYPHYYPKYGKGTDYWYGLVIWAGTPRGVIYERASWSVMWDIYHSNSARNMSLATCAFMPAPAIPACGALVTANYTYLHKLVTSGLHQRLCLRIRFPAPPASVWYAWQYTLVTCRI